VSIGSSSKQAAAKGGRKTEQNERFHDKSSKHLTKKNILWYNEKAKKQHPNSKAPSLLRIPSVPNYNLFTFLF